MSPSPVPRSGSPAPAPKHSGPMTPAEAQAAALQKLLANPDKPVHIPAPPQAKTLRPPREMMKNVSGSSAGAGSGEFHVYKHARRREYERLKLMEEEASKNAETEAFKKRAAELEAVNEEKTSKNRAKRDKKKARALAAKAGSSSAATGSEGQATKEGEDTQESEETQVHKRRKIAQPAEGAGFVFRKPGEEDE